MKIIFIVFLLIISYPTHSINIINNIVFDGLQRTSIDTTLFDVFKYVGQENNDENVADIIRILFSTRYFQEIQVLNDNELEILLIKVKERPIINNINYCGNKTIKTDFLKKVLNDKNVKLDEPLNDYVILELKSILEDMYCSFGQFNTIVKICVVSLSRNRVNLNINFSEGPVAKIKKIKFFGNYFFNEKILRSKLSLCDRKKWWNIFYSTQYHKKKLFHDLENLQNFYFNCGYAHFHINETQINLTKNKKDVYLTLYLTEGKQYTISSIMLDSNMPDYLPEIKKCVSSISPGELYSIDKIKRIQSNIQKKLGEYGYIQSKISIEYNFDDTNRTIKLYIYIDTGNRFYVREVLFTGNEITVDTVLRREIYQSENSPLNCAHILKDQERLKRLDYFQFVDFHVAYVPDTSNQVDLIYQVKEKNTGNLNVSFGIGTESGVNIQLGMHQNNLLGTGNSVSFTGIKNSVQTYSEILVSTPHIQYFPINMEGKIFYNNFSTGSINLSDYNLNNHGISMNFLYPFTEKNTFRTGINYISNDLSNIVPQVAIWRYFQSLKINPEIFTNKYYNNGNINFCVKDILFMSEWIFNNLDHSYFPTFGSSIDISSKLALPGSDNQYYKIKFEGNHYISLDQNSNWVLMGSVYVGYSGSFLKKESPFYDNFYAGGINTIRGFKLNSVGPKAAYYCCNNTNKNYDTCKVKNSQDSVGGNAVVFVRTELVVPPTLYYNEQWCDVIRFSLFLDAGTVWDTFWKNTVFTRAAGIADYSIPNNIRVSTGVSLKWVSPIGPVIFSYSKLVKKYLGDIEEPFQFSIGKTW